MEINVTDEVLRARAGDQGAFEVLFKSHLRSVQRRVGRFLRSDSELDDVVQEVFVKAFTNLHALTDPPAFSGWLSTIAVHQAEKTLRHRRLLRRLGLVSSADHQRAVDGSPSHTVSPAIAAEARQAYVLLDALPVEARVAFVLRHVEQMTVPEVAAQMGISERTVKRRVALAEAELARAVKPKELLS